MKRHQLLLAVILLISAAARLEAGVILTVDVSDPAAVVFSSTVEDSKADVTDTTDNGVTLIGFFTGNTMAIDVLLSSNQSLDVLNAATGTSRSALNRIYIGADKSWTTRDLAFFSQTVFPTYFRLGEPALSGTVMHDLTNQSSDFPAVLSEGIIVAGEPTVDNVLNNVIGRWQVVQQANSVPEPGTFGMMLSCGLMALAGRSWRIRRRKGDLDAS